MGDHSKTMTSALMASSFGRTPKPTPSSEMLTPAELQAIRTGVLPFEKVYEEWFDFVWRSVRRLGASTDRVDDLVQEVFIVVYRKLKGFEGRSTLKTWLFGIALRVVRDHRRKMARRREDGIDDALVDQSQSPSACAEQNEAVALLHSLLSGLDDERRVVFIMAELEQMSAPEMAEVLGINVNTIYSRLRAARRDFDEAVKRHRAQEKFRVDGSAPCPTSSSKAGRRS